MPKTENLQVESSSVEPVSIEEEQISSVDELQEAVQESSGQSRVASEVSMSESAADEVIS